MGITLGRGSTRYIYGHQHKALPTTAHQPLKRWFIFLFCITFSPHPINTHTHLISPPKIIENGLSQTSPLPFSILQLVEMYFVSPYQSILRMPSEFQSKLVFGSPVHEAMRYKAVNTTHKCATADNQQTPALSMLIGEHWLPEFK